MSDKLQLPMEVTAILTALEKKHEAYVVGGCVRDSLLGQTPHDWDICTAATPEEVINCFEGERVLLTGLQHGTVTLVRNGVPYEITTFRIDGDYTDGRHPDEVSFVRDLREDLARRDFTVNAMAYSPRTGLVDCFGGQKDLKERQVRAVGEPTARFEEDALRILRALRFAAVYSFGIEEKTASAARKLKNTMNNVAVERIFSEFTRLLCGIGAERVLMAFPDVIGVFLPEILPTVGFQQQNPRHIYDVWNHTAVAIGIAPPDKSVRMALLFHDLGKPFCDPYVHAQKSAEICRTALKRLRCDVDTARMTELLVKYHGAKLCPISEPGLRQVRRWLNKLGEERIQLLLQVQRADILAQDKHYASERLLGLENFEKFMNLARVTNQCYCLRDMKVDGKALIKIGIKPGPELGRILGLLLEEIIEGHLQNEREILLKRAKEL